MRKITRLQVIAIIAASLVYLISRYAPFNNGDAVKDADVPEGNGLYVVRVIDGDTLVLSDSSKVRLIGVDTPEAHYSEKLSRDARRSRKDTRTIQQLGKRASSFTKELCYGKKVRLEHDVKKSDRYGRVLAYVYLEDGTFVNAKILEEGFGHVMTIPPNVKYAQHFLMLQQDARDKARGLWAVTDTM